MSAVNLRLAALRVELAVQRGNPLVYATAALCLLAAVMGLLLVPAWQEQLQALQTEVQRAQAGSQRLLSEPATPVVSSDQRNLQDFLAVLGDARHAEQQLQSLFVMARGLEIGLPQGQYKMSCDDSGLLCNYRAQLPVKGSYSQVRAFIEECLQVLPSLSLDEVGFKRETVTDEELEVRLVMTLVVRAPVLAGPAGLRASP
jgi:hypothetical protein